MSPDKNSRLFAAFPLLYSQHKRVKSRMSEGFLCGDGWFDIVWKLSERLEAMIHEVDNETDGWHPSACYVRERDGQLDFVLSNQDFVTDEMRHAIKDAQVECMKQCEICWRPAHYAFVGRTPQTLCVKHIGKLRGRVAKP